MIGDDVALFRSKMIAWNVLTIIFELVDGLIDLLGIKFFEIDGFFDSVVVGGDGGGAKPFALSHYDSGVALSNGFIVVGDIFSTLSSQLPQVLWLLAGLAEDEP